MDELSYSEEDLLPLSHLSQYYYCKRRAGLIMLEQQWADNIHTAKGEVIHERVHELGKELRSGQAQIRSIPLRTFKLGLTGYSDCVELLSAKDGFPVPGFEGLWQICPVEYKSGKKRSELEYEVQLCAQAMCLEEMWECRVREGYVYYSKDRKRMLVEFTSELRRLVIEGADELHKMITSGITPLPLKSRKCAECSLSQICMPGMERNTQKYLESIRKAAERGMED